MKWQSTIPSVFRAGLAVGLAALMLFAVAADSLMVSSTEELGEFLVDGEGMSVYLFLPDEASTSTCTGDCAEAWPPVQPPAGFMEEMELGEAVNADLLGTIQREDGTSQITYNGWPLYYFVQDEEAGATAGQGVGGNWYLVSAEGNPLGADTSTEGEGAGDASSEESPESDDPDGGEAGKDASGDAAEGSASSSAGEAIPFETLMAEGETVYQRNCASCHGEQGDEANGSHVVEIVESERAVENTDTLLRRILFGGSYMPAFGDVLSDRQVAAVATYVRNSWGFDHPPVSVEEVVEQRERFQ